MGDETSTKQCPDCGKEAVLQSEERTPTRRSRTASGAALPTRFRRVIPPRATSGRSL